MAHFFLVFLLWNVSTTKRFASSPGCRESTLPNGAHPAPTGRNRTLPRPKQCRTPTRSLASVDKEFDSCQTCALHTRSTHTAPCLFRCTHPSASLPSAPSPFSAPAETQRQFVAVPDICFDVHGCRFYSDPVALFYCSCSAQVRLPNNILNNQRDRALLICAH